MKSNQINNISLVWKILHFEQDFKSRKLWIGKIHFFLIAFFYGIANFQGTRKPNFDPSFASHDLEKLWTFAKNVIFSMMVNFIWHWMLITWWQLVKSWRRKADNIFLEKVEITYVLGVKVRNMKMDFNTGGTWRRVGQWTLMMKIYDF